MRPPIRSIDGINMAGSAWQPHWNAEPRQLDLEFAGTGNTEVEDAGRERCIRSSLTRTASKNVGKMRRVAGATGGDDGDPDSVADRGSEFAIEATMSAVSIHRGEQ